MGVREKEVDGKKARYGQVVGGNKGNNREGWRKVKRKGKKMEEE